MSTLVRSRRALGVVLALTVAIATAVAYVVLTADPARAKEFATLRVLEGTVEVRGSGGGSFAAAADGDTLREGDTVRTARPGRADIRYFDGSATRLDEGTTFTLVELSSDPGVPGNKVIRGEQSAGTTLNRVVKLTDSQSRFDVETPTAVASVRGTKYAVIVHPDGSTEYWVFDGSVVLVLANGETVVLEAGEGVRLDPEGVPGEIFSVDPDDAATLCELDQTLCVDTDDTVLGETVTRDEEDEPTTIVVERTTTGSDDGDQPEPEDTDPPQGPGGGSSPGSSIDDGPAGEQEQRNASFAFSSSEPGSTFECSLDEAEYEPCESPQEYGGLPDGEHVFRVRARNGTGTSGPPQERRWTVSAPPETTIESGPEGIVEADTAVFRVSSDEPDAVFGCSIDDEETFGACPTGSVLTRSLAATGGAALDIVLTQLEDGEHTIRVQARDSTNKVDATPSQRSWTVTVTPDTTIVSGPDDVTQSTDATFAFTSTLAGATFECSVDNASFASCESPKTYPDLGQGPHTFQVRSSKGGRTDDTPAAHNWRIGDPSAITITLTWVGPPRDLDLHLHTPGGGHVAYNNRCLSGEDGCWASLDRDVVNSSQTNPGSETITIFPARQGFVTGTYTVHVQNFACDASFAASGARVEIFGGGAGSTFAVSSAAGPPASKEWNVASATVQAGGATTVAGTQTLSSVGCGGSSELAGRAAPVEIAGAPTPMPAAELIPATVLVRAEPRGDGARVEWEPEDLEAEVRLSTGDDPPSRLDQGELACRGTGHCVIESLDRSRAVWLTVFPNGVEELEPVEDVTSVRLRAEEPEDGGGTGGGTGDQGSEDPPDDAESPEPDPEPEPEPEPEPGIVEEEQPPADDPPAEESPSDADAEPEAG